MWEFILLDVTQCICYTLLHKKLISHYSLHDLIGSPKLIDCELPKINKMQPQCRWSKNEKQASNRLIPLGIISQISQLLSNQRSLPIKHCDLLWNCLFSCLDSRPVDIVLIHIRGHPCICSWFINTLAEHFYMIWPCLLGASACRCPLHLAICTTDWCWRVPAP